MFEYIPFYRGKTFTYLEYFMFLISAGLTILSIIFYFLSKMTLKCFMISDEEFAEYSPSILEKKRENRLIKITKAAGFLRSGSMLSMSTSSFKHKMLANVPTKENINLIINNFQFSDEEDEVKEETTNKMRRTTMRIVDRISSIKKSVVPGGNGQFEDSKKGFELYFETQSDYRLQVKNLRTVQKYKEMLQMKTIVDQEEEIIPLRFKCGKNIAFFFHFMSYLFIAVIPCMFAGFEFISPYVGATITFILLFRAYRQELGLENAAAHKKSKKKRIKDSLLGQFDFAKHCNEFKIESYFSFCGILALTLLIMSVFFGSCLTAGRSPFGIPINFGWSSAAFTTGFIRVFKNETVNCFDLAGPCHFMTTVGKDVSTEALITLHLATNYSSSDITLHYDEHDFYKQKQFMRKIGNRTNVTKIDKITRWIMTYHITDLKPNTEYKFIINMIQGYEAEYQKKLEQNITCLAYLADGEYDRDRCEAEEKMEKGKTKMPFIFRTLPKETTTREVKMVSMANIGTEDIVDDWIWKNTRFDEIDLIILNGNVAMDNGEINCYCLWDYVFHDFEALFARIGRIIPILPNAGDLDTGFKANNNDHLKRKKFQYSNSELKTIPFSLFLPSHSPQSWKTMEETGILKYEVSGTDFVVLDSGFYVNLNDPYRKQEFSRVTSDFKTAIVMIYGAIYPSCPVSKWDYDVKLLTEHWKNLFDLRADLVIEGGSNGLKREINLISMMPQSTETVYIGDSYISGEAPDACYTDDIKKYDYNVRNKEKAMWFITIKGDTIKLVAANLEKELDSYTIDSTRENN